MRRLRFFTLYIYFISTLLLCSCNKDKDADPTVDYNSCYVSQWHAFSEQIDCTYNANGQIESIAISKKENNEVYYAINFKYNTEDKVSEIIYPNDGIVEGTTKFEYSDDLVLATESYEEDFRKLEYHLNSGKPIEIILFDLENEEWMLDKSVRIEYDGLGNVVKAVSIYYDHLGEIDDFYSDTTYYEYSELKNPFYHSFNLNQYLFNEFTIDVFEGSFQEFPSPYLPSKIFYRGYEDEYNYYITVSGLLSSIIVTEKSEEDPVDMYEIVSEISFNCEGN